MKFEQVIWIGLYLNFLRSAASKPHVTSGKSRNLFEAVGRTTGIIADEGLDKEAPGAEAATEGSKGLHVDWESNVTHKDVMGKLMLLSRMPEAQFYTEENLRGRTVKVRGIMSMDTRSHCSLIRNNIMDPLLKSVDPQGTCLRLFFDDHCMGPSLAIYPGSQNVPNILRGDPSLLQRFVALGPCYKNEFAYSEINPSPEGSLTVEKNPTNPLELPDLFPSDPDECSLKELASLREAMTSPSPAHARDCQNRTAIAIAFACNPEHIEGCIPRDSQRQEEQLEHGSGGSSFIISPKLGGSTEDAINYIAFEEEENAREWERIAQGLVDSEGDEAYTASVLVRLAYENESVREPFGLLYHIFESWNYMQSGVNTYGFIRA